MGSTPKIIECLDVFEYFRRVELMGRRSWVYRGHSRYSNSEDGDWKLESSLHRFLQVHKGKAIKSSSWYPRERALLRRFTGAAHIHLSHIPEKSDQLSWLALMQHYGSPTRLIDFTFNPAAALYFAMREVNEASGAFSIHALHLDTVRAGARVARKLLERYTDKEPPINPRADEYGIGLKAAKADFVGFYDGTQLNPRQEAQDGLFLVPSRIDLNIEDWLENNLVAVKTGSPWVEFVFPNEKGDYYKMVNQLVQVGMTAKRLFPGLEGICESMKYAWLEVAKNLVPNQFD
jgi:FRG domain